MSHLHKVPQLVNNQDLSAVLSDFTVEAFPLHQLTSRDEGIWKKDEEGKRNPGEVILKKKKPLPETVISINRASFCVVVKLKGIKIFFSINATHSCCENISTQEYTEGSKSHSSWEVCSRITTGLCPSRSFYAYTLVSTYVISY